MTPVSEFAQASERVVEACGEAPGLANNLQAFALSLLDQPDELLVYDGGIPMEPRPPWNYATAWRCA